MLILTSNSYREFVKLSVDTELSGFKCIFLSYVFNPNESITLLQENGNFL